MSSDVCLSFVLFICKNRGNETDSVTHHFQEVEAGSSVTVECTAAANPAPASYVWSRVAEDTWRHAGRHLRLRNVTAADSGEYRSDPSNILR